MKLLDLVDNVFTRYVLVGLLSTATHVGVLAMQMEWLDANVLVATVIAFGASLVVSFGLNYLFAFRSNARVIESALKFTIVTLLGLGLNLVVMEVFVNRVGLHYGFATLVAIVVVTLNNFSLHFFWTFRKPRH